MSSSTPFSLSLFPSPSALGWASSYMNKKQNLGIGGVQLSMQQIHMHLSLPCEDAWWIPFPLHKLGVNLWKLDSEGQSGFLKASFNLELNILSKGIKCKFKTNRKAVSWRHILPLHDNEVKDQGLDDSGGGERNHFWIALIYSTNTIKLQCSVLLHPHRSTLAQQIHQNRLNAFSWKWK